MVTLRTNNFIVSNCIFFKTLLKDLKQMMFVVSFTYGFNKVSKTLTDCIYVDKLN